MLLACLTGSHLKLHALCPRRFLCEYCKFATMVGAEVNRGLRYLQDVARGGNLKQFLIAVVSLWAGAVIGGWCNFLTVMYIGFVAAHTLPVLYERYEDEVDYFVYKVLDQMQHKFFTKTCITFDNILKGAYKSLVYCSNYISGLEVSSA